MTSDFQPIRMLDNFYQTSAFYPMPVVLITTVSESGMTNIGPYSLCFPYVIADQGKHAMMLIAREDSNTAMNIKRTGVCAINFIEDKKKYLENAVLLGYPGDTTEEKMKDSIFTLLPSMRENKERGVRYPEIIDEAFQVMECTWDDSFDRCLCEGGDNFCLKIDNIFLKKKYHEAIIHGMDAKSFPRMPVDYGFRDNIYFWFSETKKPYKIRIPESKGTSANTVFYAAKRFDPSVEWTMEACEKIVQVPRVFLKRVISGVVDAAKKEGLEVITPEFMDKVRDKRKEEKGS